MYRALFVVALALMPESCAKILGKKPSQPVEADPTPTAVPVPVPITSATTPPIWHPPESPTSTTATASDASSASAPSVSPELVKARAASDNKEFKKVKSLLDKKVRGGKCTPEESQLLYKACVALKDKTCTDAVKAKHPDDITDDPRP